jgi:hypothetical protein
VTYALQCANDAGSGNVAYATVTVNPPPCSDGAEFVTEQAPDVMPVNWSFTGNVTMKNTGTCTWAGSGGYALTSVNSNWGTVSVPLSVDIPPGGQVSFAISAVAPGTVGTYNFQWIVTRGGFAFGGPSPAVSVNVNTDPYVFNEVKKRDPSELITYDYTTVSQDKKTGATCYYVTNWQEGWVPASYVFRVAADHLEQSLTWCVKKGKFACGTSGAGIYACPFHRDVSHFEHFNWDFTGYEYGSCSTSTCDDLSRGYVGSAIAVNIYVKGNFRDCLDIPLAGRIYCTHDQMRVGDRVYPDGRHADTY